MVHASYVTFPWSTKEETHAKSIQDIQYASRCANILGIWGLNIHLPKEYHLSTGFEERIAECFLACEPPCVLLFEIVGSSTLYVSQGKLPALPIQRMKACQVVIDRIAKGMKKKVDWGFCFDTAHAFIQGQPLTTSDDIQRFFADAEGVNIIAIHLNGSLHPFRSGRDQHAITASVFDYIWGKDSSGLITFLRWIVENKTPTILERSGSREEQNYEQEINNLYALLDACVDASLTKKK